MNLNMVNWNSVFPIILDFLRVVLTWPVAILILGIAFLLKYSEAIRQFIANMGIKGTLPGGGQFEISSHQQTELKNRFDVGERESAEEDSIENLKKQLEEARKNWLFENTYNLIYGSQIRLLEHLVRKGSSGDSDLQLYSLFYDSTCRVYPTLRSYPFLTYMKFLEDRQLVKKQDTAYVITDQGFDFLNHIDVNTYAKNKAF